MDDRMPIASLPTHAKTADGKLHRVIEFDEDEPGIVWISNGFSQFSVPADKVVFYFAENIGILDGATSQYRCEKCGTFLKKNKEDEYVCSKHGTIHMLDQSQAN